MPQEYEAFSLPANEMTTTVLPPRFLSIATVAATLITACGGGYPAPSPVEPENTVRAFLNAVKGNSLRAMGDLWGTSGGPASRSMGAQELEQRLTVMRIYLEHERYEIVPATDALRTRGKEVVRVRLTRKGCTPVVPFTLVRYRGGWLISEVDLAAAGNPQRVCTSD